LLDVGSLKELVRANGPLEPGEAVSIIAQVAGALDAAHADGLVHRDVKPENVLLSRDNFAYLADFGIAHAGRDLSVTAPGSFIGSCLYECLTGRPPFEGAEPQQQMSAHVLSPPPRPSIMRPEIGQAFDDVIARALAKEPAARFSSAGELARAATAAVPSSPKPPPSAYPATQPASTRRSPTSYPTPEDTGYGPSPPPPPRPERPAQRPILARAPVVLGAVGVAMLIAAAVIAVFLVFANNRHGSLPVRHRRHPRQGRPRPQRCRRSHVPWIAPTGWASSAIRHDATPETLRLPSCERRRHPRWSVRPGHEASTTEASA